MVVVVLVFLVICGLVYGLLLVDFGSYFSY